MKKPLSQKMMLIWAMFGLLTVTSILAIIFKGGEMIVTAISVTFGGMSSWLFKIRSDEKQPIANSTQTISTGGTNG